MQRRVVLIGKITCIASSSIFTESVLTSTSSTTTLGPVAHGANAITTNTLVVL